VNDGGPAFPKPAEISTQLRGQTGMSLRDWFAGQALPECIKVVDTAHGNSDHAADLAYTVADAMLKRRER
jgi:hypothetical protein